MTSKKLLKYAAGVGFCLLVLILGVMFGAFSRKPEPMPNPNGYDDLVRAGAAMEAIPSQNPYQIKAFLATNQAALSLARTGLARKCRSHEATDSTNRENILYETLCIGYLADAFIGQAKIELDAGRTNEAVECYLDLIATGVKSAEGGLEGARAWQIAWEEIARQALTNIISVAPPQNAAPLCRKICAKLAELDAEEEPAADIADRTRKYLFRTYSWRYKLVYLQLFIPSNRHVKSLIQACGRNTLQRRQMILAFAARAYELEHGKPPPNAAALVPDYLTKIPQDPATGTNLVLQAAVSSR